MSETTAAFRKVFEYSLLEAESAVKHYRSLLGMPPVENNTNYVKEIESLKSQLQGKTEENEVLHRKINDLMLKLCRAYRKRDELAEKLRKAESGESVKITELNKEVAELQKKNDELSEQLKNKQILDFVLAQKYWTQQNALQSCERGEACEVELDGGAPFLEKGYFFRITKKEYEMMKDDRLSTHIAFMKRSDK